MYCQHCGTDAGDSAICPECGKSILIQNESAETVQQSSQKPKRKNIIIIAAVAAVILIALVIGIGLSKGGNKPDPDQAVAAENASETVKSAKKDNAKEIEKTVSEAKALAANGQYADAIELLHTVPQTDDVSSLIREYAEVYLNAADFGCYWKEDEMSDYHWAFANGQNDSVQDNSFCVYIHQIKADASKFGFHLFASFIGYSGKSEWVFPKTIRVKGDKNEAIDLDCGLKNKSDMDGRAMREWVNFTISNEEFNAICKTAKESSSITVRFSGNTYHRDFTLTPDQIEALNVIGAYGSALADVYGTVE